MNVSIDAAGRVVIPKRVRDELGLHAGDALDLQADEGEIRLRRPQRRIELIRSEYGHLTASPDADLPGLGPEEVRELLERSRRREL